MSKDSPPPRSPRPGMFGPGRMMGGAPVDKAASFRESSTRLISQLRPERILITATLVLSTISIALAVSGPKILGHATNLIFAGAIGKNLPADRSKEQIVEGLRKRGDGRLADMLSSMDVIPGHGIDFAHVARVLGWVVVIYLMSAVFGVFQGRLATIAIQRTIFRLRQEVEAKLSRLPLRYFDQQSRGEVLSRATNDTDNIGQTLQQTLSQFISSMLTIVGVLSMMFWISPLLAIIALVTIPLSVMTAAAIGKRAQPQFITQWASTGQLNGHIEDMYTGHDLVKAFDMKEYAEKTFSQHNEALFLSSFKAHFASGIIQPALFFIGNLNYVLVAVIGGLRVASGSISLGDVQAFIQYSRQFTHPLSQVASMANLLQSGVASAERVFALLDAQEQEPNPENPATIEEIQGLVRFENVTFRYTEDAELIDNMSLTVKPGQTVAIVGPTGAGKTTLVNLIMRFYEVTGGRITIDDVDISTMSREYLRSNIGMVLQDTWLFGGTIADNIAYGARHPSQQDIIAAAKAAHVDRFVRTLPQGYETVIDESGSNISAGEKQLITIARAFLTEPSILILDEATSSVDTRTEVLIQKAMSTLRSGRTSFVIAHRLSTIRDADLILVMENGAIVEQGTHETLLAADGAYTRLYSAQFASACTTVM